MHENATILHASTRDRVGSRYARRLRQSGRLPAVLYGHGEAPASVHLDAKDALLHLHRGEKVFQITIDGGTPQVALLKEVQYDYLGSNIVHADFARVSLTDRVETRVPLHLIGEAVGLKTAGAILMHPTSELEIECAVSDIPEYLELDITALEAGHSMSASDVPLPSGMTLVTDPHAVVAQIVVQVEEKVAEAAPAEAPAAPEVITEKKREEENEE
ncbi:MAG: 50S ribosomal protein L25 [Leptolyngbya sp. PLA2]|nr:50S ribosomal protein L25 [Leptolyngbya sp.]MCE7971390.1 50S ribosomal protein L25 [Leptolyngbya sp. PL-A2]MCQ3940606.1 50S ribosomal protein L25 [cyanobacterium CYA1]MCZ7632397.1 50S ribosomal protein L25 [Phycisphaerales bacterium]MDL1903576.1 50S ribosomal protein L25 [Synechococcales cyanobacterium CNB]GIK20047.1 MAG: 50S ribosomal protein L25 [Planctomycetota bacterium]